MDTMQIVGGLLIALIAIVIFLVFAVGGFLMKFKVLGLLGRIFALLVACVMAGVIGFLVVLACLIVTLMLI